MLSDLTSTGAAGKSCASVMPEIVKKPRTAPPARMPAKAACLVPKGRGSRLKISEGSSCVSRLEAKIAIDTMVVPPRSTK